MRTLGAVMVWIALSGVAHADDNLEKARAYFQAGVDAYDEARYEVALREFQHAHALSHNPALYFNMAACEEHSNHFQAASLLLRQYLIEKPDADDRAKVEARIKVLEEREETLKRPEPPLPPPRLTPTPQVAPAPVVESHPPPRRRVASWAMLGATGFVGIGAIAAGGYAVSLHDSLKNSCGTTIAGCTQDQRDNLRSATVATDVLIGLTAAAAVVTVVLFIVEPRLGKHAERAHLSSAGVVF